MSSQADVLRVIANEYLWPKLQPLGFERAAGRFVRQVDNLLHLIELQRSVGSSSRAIRFRINYGVLSVRVAEFFGAATSELRSYDVQSSHWIDRAGPQDDPSGDGWWEVGVVGDLPEVASDVLHVLNQVVLPALDQLSSEDGLLQLWRGGRGPGITEAQRLANLAALLVTRGQKADLPPVVARLRELAERSAVRDFARRQLKRLEPHLTPTAPEQTQEPSDTRN